MKSILLVDDSRFLRLANERMLQRAGYNVLTAADGEEAVRLAKSANPDLILLDMLLPKVSGPAVLKLLRSDPKTASIPVVVLSSLSQTNEEKLKAEGAAAYFEKSRLSSDADLQALLKIISRSLAP
jgi:CheY-like chemotaxis protein